MVATIGQFLATVIITVANQPLEVDLVQVTPADVGCGKKGFLEAYMDASDFFGQVSSHGLNRCQAEVGAAVAQAYMDHPWGPTGFFIAMEPLKGRESLGSHPYVILVTTEDGGPYMGHWPEPIMGVHRDDRWIFVRPHQS